MARKPNPYVRWLLLGLAVAAVAFAGLKVFNTAQDHDGAVTAEQTG